MDGDDIGGAKVIEAVDGLPQAVRRARRVRWRLGGMNVLDGRYVHSTEYPVIHFVSEAGRRRGRRHDLTAKLGAGSSVRRYLVAMLCRANHDRMRRFGVVAGIVR